MRRAAQSSWAGQLKPPKAIGADIAALCGAYRPPRAFDAPIVRLRTLGLPRKQSLYTGLINGPRLVLQALVAE